MTTINLSTPADLYTLMIAPAPGPSGTYSLADSYVVIQPINMTGYALPSESIGNTDFNNGFTGNFNGGNFLITINNTVASYNGLFSIISGNSLIQMVHITYNNGPTAFQSIFGVGGLVGRCNSATGGINNCNVTIGDNYGFFALDTGNSNPSSAGGLVGSVTDTSISNCTITIGNNFIMTGSISNISSSVYLGLIVGYLNSNNGLNNCKCTVGNGAQISTTSSTAGVYYGGLAGNINNASNNAITVGNNFTATGITLFGGLVGTIPNSLISVINNYIIFPIF